jgi:hypothetical protein
METAAEEDFHQRENTSELQRKLIEIYQRKIPPEPEEYLRLLERAQLVLDGEGPEIRPQSSSGLPGGIVYLKGDTPTIIVPDIHARIDFFLAILLKENENGMNNLQMLASNMLQIVCVGDGFHAEGREASRWERAYEEYADDYKNHNNMDEEMRESLGVMEMVKEVKCAFPANFHFLKGNHENICNEHGEGNYAFRKYSYEGAMVVYYIEKFYGEEFLYSYAQFEKSVPLLAVGRNFLVSHAEPVTFFNREDIIEYRDRPEVVYGLTWTANDEAEDGSVREMLGYYLDEEHINDYYYFGGHRPIPELYLLRAEGRYVQIHNPNRFIVALIGVDKPINLDEAMVEIDGNISSLIDREPDT